MRDLRKIRDKVEIKLDNRQIAAIFIGALVLLAVVFYLGVKVGSRLEQVRRVPTPRPELTQGAPLLTPTPWERGVVEPLGPGETAESAPGAEQTPKIISETAVGPDGLVSDEVGGIRYTFDGPGPQATPPPLATPAPRTPTPAATPAAPATPRPGSWTVQVASFQDRAQADAEAARLKDRGWPAFVVRADVPEKGTYFRVRVGQFEDKPGAEKMRDAIVQAEGKDAFITRSE